MTKFGIVYQKLEHPDGFFRNFDGSRFDICVTSVKGKYPSVYRMQQILQSDDPYHPRACKKLDDKITIGKVEPRP